MTTELRKLMTRARLTYGDIARRLRVKTDLVEFAVTDICDDSYPLKSDVAELLNAEASRTDAGFYIRRLRSRVDASQAQFCAGFDIAPAYLSKVEAGKATPSLDFIVEAWKSFRAHMVGDPDNAADPRLLEAIVCSDPPRVIESLLRDIDA